MSAAPTYTVILQPAEEGGYVVRVPALPEIVTEGDTEEEALAKAQEAIELVLESRRERGESIPDNICGHSPLVEAEIQKGVEAADRGELIAVEIVLDRLEDKYLAMARKGRTAGV